MPRAEDWLAMAKESLRGAQAAMQVQAWRSSVSRSYYAAYQAATAMLLHAGERPPIVEQRRRGSWSHVATPEMVKENLKGLMRDRRSRLRAADTLKSLYRLRVQSDYVSGGAVAASEAGTALREARIFVTTAAKIIEN